MYGFPPDFDASFFVGRELEQVSFTVNTVDLVFDGGVGVTVESGLLLRVGPNYDAVKQTPPLMSSSLMTLLGHRVRSADAAADGTLTLHFDGGASITCLDDSREYESFHIRVDGREITV